MNTIALPQKIEFKKGKHVNNELVEIESFYPGYGATIGNSIRRVLLSSLPGAAVVGVKIQVATHEFMSLPNIKEDILTIILNLKKLRLKVHSEEIVKLTLDVTGEKAVTAKNINPDGLVEIINKDLHIGTITSKTGNLSMEISVSCGRGYETVELRENKKGEIGYIEIDSMFSPVSSVGMSVEDARVGKMTNWDKLILDITTDGILSPKEAFNQAVEIILDQFTALIPAKEEKKEDKKEAKKTSKKKVE
ncbi:MAG: DNA-directed RNA polymerase subunit alpha [Candidatus Falkowbacteria bacterium]|nr:DNA-directed RNA polymerase subunit alpha [Candidatus Falkowbacteria bacterium]